MQAASYLTPDPLAARLPSSPGTCILGIRDSAGRYLSRTVSVPRLAGGPVTSGVLRFVYRGWSALDSVPSRIGVCTIANTKEAIANAEIAFMSKVVPLATLIEEQSPPSVSKASVSMVRRRPRLTIIPSALRNPHVPIVVADGISTPSNVGISATQACTPDPIIPEPGCEGQGGGSNGGGGSPTFCDLNAIIPEPGCIVENETPWTLPPPPNGSPTTPSVGSLPSSPVICVARLDNIHLSTSANTYGDVSVHASTTCPVSVPYLLTTVTLFRGVCVLGVICSNYPVGTPGVKNQVNHIFANTNSKVGICDFGQGMHYFSASSYHAIVDPSLNPSNTSLSWKPEFFGFECFTGSL